MNNASEHKRLSKPKAWAILLSTFLCLWVFAVAVGPWLEKRIPVFDEIVKVIVAEDIDSGAYFYTEIKGSYDGERYLRDSLRRGDGKYFGLSWPFMSGIALCLAILIVGFRFMPNETNEPDNPLSKLSEDHL